MGDRIDDIVNQPNFCDGTATVEIVDGALRIENTQEQSNNWDLQPFVLDWFNTVEGEDYVIRVWMKADVDGYANLSIGTWGTSGSATLEFQQSDDFKLYTINHTAAVTSTSNDEHILWQMGKTVGVVYIQKIQILKAVKELPPLSKYGIWTPLIINSDMEGDDVSCFYAKIANDSTNPVPHAIINDGVGVDGSRGILVEATEKVNEAWDNQFWFRFTEPVESGTKYRVSFDYKADQGGAIATQAHAEPGDYIHYDLFGNIEFSDDWQTYEKEGQVSSQQSTGDKKFLSVAFNLNDIADANNYYFDNIYFDIYAPTIDAMYSKTCMRIRFPYYTNIIDMVKNGANGEMRLMMPTKCITVKVNGKVVPLMSVEADLTGELYVFFDESWDADVLEEEETEVLVTWNNLEDETCRLLHMETNGALGEVVEFTDAIGHYDEEDELLEVMSYRTPGADAPELVAPEGWINLITNGNLATDDVSSYFTREQSVSPDTIYSSVIVPGAGENFSRGIVVKSSDNPEAVWNTQFWIYLNQSLPVGSVLHIEFDYMAKQEARVDAEAHAEPTDFIFDGLFRDIYFIPEWQHFCSDIIVGDELMDMHSIAFDLATESFANEYYFDNFGVWAQLPEPITEWTNIIANSDMEGDDNSCFYVKEQGIGGPYLANFTEGIGIDGGKAVKVQSGDDPANPWDTQFFVRMLYQLPAGTPYRVSFDFRADYEAEANTEAHANPSDYIYSTGMGDLTFADYWQSFEFEGVISSDQSMADHLMQTIAFDLAVVGYANVYVFDNVKFEVPANVLAKLNLNPDENALPYPANQNGDVNHDEQVDVTDAVLIIDHILLKNPQNFDATVADVNNDGSIDVTDVVMVIDAILGKIQLARGVEASQKDLSAYTAFQMDLTVPAGYVLEGVELTEIAKDSHKLAYNMLADGRCRVVVFSMDNEALPGAWDEVIRLNLRGQGDAMVNVDRAMFVTVGGERHELLLNGTTSIAQLSTLNSQFSIVYDLQGRKVEKTSKGVYVIDGKKVVIK